jgi:hypothetical protein
VKNLKPVRLVTNNFLSDKGFAIMSGMRGTSHRAFNWLIIVSSVMVYNRSHKINGCGMMMKRCCGYQPVNVSATFSVFAPCGHCVLWYIASIGVLVRWCVATITISAAICICPQVTACCNRLHIIV